MSRLLALAAGAVVLVLVLLAVHVGLSLFGRGGRSAQGERRHVVEDGRRIVYFVRPAQESTRQRARVVLLASLGRSVADFNELTQALNAAGYATLAIESRGIGGSGGGGPGKQITLHDLAADVESVLRAEGIGSDETIHVVGHAFGNRVARTFARDHPERVASISLIAAGGLVPVEPAISDAIGQSLRSFLPWSKRESSVRLAFFAEGNEIPSDWRGGWWLWGALAQLGANSATSSEEFWDAGEISMLVIQGEVDRVAPPNDSGRRLAASFPDRVELVMVPHAGHALLPEQPERIRDALISFLDRRSGAANL